MPKVKSHERNKSRDNAVGGECEWDCSPSKCTRRTRSLSQAAVKTRDTEFRKQAGEDKALQKESQNIRKLSQRNENMPPHSIRSSKPRVSGSNVPKELKTTLSPILLNFQNEEQAGRCRRDRGGQVRKNGAEPKKEVKAKLKTQPRKTTDSQKVGTDIKNKSPSVEIQRPQVALVNLKPKVNSPKQPGGLQVPSVKRKIDSSEGCNDVEGETSKCCESSDGDKLLDKSDWSEAQLEPQHQTLSSSSPSVFYHQEDLVIATQDVSQSILADLDPDLLGALVSERLALQEVPMLQESPELNKLENAPQCDRVCLGDPMWWDTGKYRYKSQFHDLNTVVDLNDRRCGGGSSCSEDTAVFDITEAYAQTVKKRFYRKKLVNESLNAWYRYNYRKSVLPSQKMNRDEDVADEVEGMLGSVDSEAYHTRMNHPAYELAETIWNMNNSPSPSIPRLDEVLPEDAVWDSGQTVQSGATSEATANIGAILESSDFHHFQYLNSTFESSEILSSSTPIKSGNGWNSAVDHRKS